MSFTDEMLYAAFRAAFVLTLDCMLRETLDRHHSIARATGFLDVYPVLQGTASQVQLECLLQTWEHMQAPEVTLSPLDNSVVNAAYATLAKMGELSTRPTLPSVWKGPKSIETSCDHWVSSKSRALQLVIDEKTSSVLIRLEAKLDDQRQTLPMFSSKEAQATVEDLISIVGRWTASREIVLGSKGLLTEDEQDILRIFFAEQSGLLR